MFPGFPEETVRFFLDLRFHNETSWFHAHREAYEAYVRKPFSQFIQAMTPTVMRIADDMETRPNKCLARINRDIRFTRDKSPYRDHMWLLFRRSGEEREHSVMYWFELSPEVVEWGVGFWGSVLFRAENIPRTPNFKIAPCASAWRKSPPRCAGRCASAVFRMRRCTSTATVTKA